MGDWADKKANIALMNARLKFGQAAVDAISEALRRARADALEEAATMIDVRWAHGVGDHYASAIRALKEGT